MLPEIVVELRTVLKPCTNGPDDPEEPDVSKFGVYCVDTKTLRLVAEKRSRVTSAHLTPAKDVTKPDERVTAPDFDRADCPEPN